MVSLGESFPREFYYGSVSVKKEFISEGLASESLTKFKEFVNSLPISKHSVELCNTVFDSLFKVNPSWFILPTSTGGKYHGGPSGKQNSVGGIYHHIAGTVKCSTFVIARYKDLLGTSFASSRELLTIACLLHDVGRMGLQEGNFYSVSNHGELGAKFISGIVSVDPSIIYGISNHMYGWKVVNIYNYILAHGIDNSLLLLAMLTESDYFCTKFLI